MILFKLLVAGAIVQLVQSDEINVSVGGEQLAFSHPSVPAVVGDTIVFRFNGIGPQNHSVVQGTFSDPCYPASNGFYSGFMPIDPGARGGIRAEFFS
jgi:hypothetical protein